MANNDIRIRMTDVSNTHSLDSVFVNDGSKLRQIAKSQLAKLLNTDGVIADAEGTRILLRDSANFAFQGMRVFGKSEQVMTTGKNKYHHLESHFPKTLNGVTFTMQSGWIVLNGTCTESANLQIDDIYLEEGTYTISANNPKNNGQELALIQVYSYELEKGLTTLDNVNNSKNTGTLPAGTYVSRIRIEAGNIYRNFKIRPQVELGTEATEYEPYSGGFTSPSPDWPQEIESTGQKNGSITIDVHSGNLIPFPYNGLNNDKNEEEVKWTINADRSISVSGTPTAQRYYALVLQYKLQKGFYTLSGCPKGGEYQKYWMYVERKSDGYVWYEVGNGVTFEVTEEGIFDIAVNVGAKAGTISNLTFYPMLNIGTEIEAYDSYTAQKIVFPVDNGFPGIPVTSGGNYTDADGQQWICDEIDLERGVYVQRITQRTLTGVETYKINSYQLSSLGRYLFEYYPGDISEESIDVPAMSNKFIYDKWMNFTSQVSECKFYAISGRMIFYLTDQTIRTVEDFQLYVTNNPITVIYALKEPVETALTDEELEGYRAAITNYPTTTILNDAGAWMDIVYTVDLDTHLNNFIAKIVGTKTSVTLLAANWTVSDNGYYYTQEVTIPNTTANSKIDLQPSPEQMIELLQNEISLFVSNNNGTILVYSLNAVPDKDMTFNAIVTEVMAV